MRGSAASACCCSAQTVPGQTRPSHLQEGPGSQHSSGQRASCSGSCKQRKNSRQYVKILAAHVHVFDCKKRLVARTAQASYRRARNLVQSQKQGRQAGAAHARNLEGSSNCQACNMRLTLKYTPPPSAAFGHTWCSSHGCSVCTARVPAAAALQPSVLG
jgi:hypothetical protein